MRVVIIGGGAVAESLARDISDAEGLCLEQVWERRFFGVSELKPADLYIIAVTDRAVGEVSRELPFSSGAVVAHTAGCVGVEELSDKIDHRAVIYPLQSFTRGRVPGEFPIFIEGTTEKALETVRRAAMAISDNVREMSSESRARLHLAAAVTNNFSNAMLSLGEILAKDAGEDFGVLRPLVAETFAKALALTSPQMAQTGAAKRSDEVVMQKHIVMLSERHPELVELYKNVSDIIWKISKKN